MLCKEDFQIFVLLSSLNWTIVVSMETATDPGIYLMGITWAVSQQIGLEVIDIGYLEITHTNLVTVEGHLM